MPWGEFNSDIPIRGFALSRRIFREAVQKSNILICILIGRILRAFNTGKIASGRGNSKYLHTVYSPPKKKMGSEGAETF